MWNKVEQKEKVLLLSEAKQEKDDDLHTNYLCSYSGGCGNPKNSFCMLYLFKQTFANTVQMEWNPILRCPLDKMTFFRSSTSKYWKIHRKRKVLGISIMYKNYIDLFVLLDNIRVSFLVLSFLKYFYPYLTVLN